jgi:hypothetical protein
MSATRKKGRRRTTAAQPDDDQEGGDPSAGSPKHKGRPVHFAGGTIEGKRYGGWLYSMLAAFRANLAGCVEEGQFRVDGQAR